MNQQVKLLFMVHERENGKYVTPHPSNYKVMGFWQRKNSHSLNLMLDTKVTNVPNENFLKIVYTNPKNASFWHEPMQQGDVYSIFITRTSHTPETTFSVIYYGFNSYYDGQQMKGGEPFASRPLYIDKVYSTYTEAMVHREVTSLWYINNPEYKETLVMTIQDPYEEEINESLTKDPTLNTTNTIGVTFLV